jgi:hypothetical protein
MQSEDFFKKEVDLMLELALEDVNSVLLRATSHERPLNGEFMG